MSNQKPFGPAWLVIVGVAATLTLAPCIATVAASTDQAANLDEIIVTSEKKSERLQDVPVPVTVVTGESLTDTNQLRIQDYFTQVPGLNVIPAIGYEQLSIRGLTTGTGNPTVAVTIDDVSYGPSTDNGKPFTPDIDPSEIERVEVLRGPQGTLYGAASLGGLIKYVTIQPSTDGISGHIEAGVSSVYNGAQPGYNVRGAINLPLGDTLAVRVSGFTREDPGYIDNPFLHIDGINEEHVSGGRIAALWRPSETISLNLSALVQHETTDGSSDVDLPINGYTGPTLSGLQQNYIPNTGKIDHTLEAFSATLKANMGRAEFTSITAYNTSKFDDSFDYTYALGGLTAATPGFGGVRGTLVDNDFTTDKFVQELRLETPINQHLDWLLGAFYTHESINPAVQSIWAENQNSGAIVANEIAFTEPQVYSEYAAFTDFTVHFTDQFSIQIGGRGSHIEQSLSEVDTGPLANLFDGGPSPFIFPEIRSSDNAFTYLVTPQFKVSPDLMVYARVASGYRASGLNESVSVSPGVPVSFKPDKTQNYEVGVKGTALDHLLSFDASVYTINWRDIQLGFQENGFSYTGNGSGSKSQGVELQVELRPAEGLTLGSWIAFSDAHLTDTLPTGSTIYGVNGDRLPYNSRFSGNILLKQEFPLGAQLTGVVGGNLSYRSYELGEFQSKPALPTDPAPVRQEYPAFAQTNLHAGMKYGAWEGNAFVNNLANKEAIINGGKGFVPPFGFVYIQPRTIGLSLVRRF